MKRRSLLTLLSAIPLLSWLKPAEAKAEVEPELLVLPMSQRELEAHLRFLYNTKPGVFEVVEAYVNQTLEYLGDLRTPSIYGDVLGYFLYGEVFRIRSETSNEYLSHRHRSMTFSSIVAVHRDWEGLHYTLADGTKLKDVQHIAMRVSPYDCRGSSILAPHLQNFLVDPDYDIHLPKGDLADVMFKSRCLQAAKSFRRVLDTGFTRKPLTGFTRCVQPLGVKN